MRKPIHIFLKIIAIICSVLFFSWTVYAINYLVDIITYIRINWMTIVILIIFLVCYGISRIKRFNIFELLYKRRYLIIIFLAICQVVFILLASAQAGADTTGVFENVQGIGSPEYFSAFTNNYFYGLYVKVIISVVSPQYAILVQELINILLLDLVILFVPMHFSIYISKSASHKSFVFLLLTLGINPTFISTYTDYLSLFTASLIFCFSIKILHTRLNLYESLFFGIIISIGSQIRITSLIFIIGLVIAVLLNFIKNRPNFRHISSKKILSIVIIILGFSVANFTTNYVKSKKVIPYTENQTKTLLYYLDLGLTSTGSNHFELPSEVLQYGLPSSKINEVVKKDLRNRFKNYNVKIALNKFRLGYEAGDFGWQTERVINEKNLVRNKITKSFIDSHIGEKVRKYIFPIDKTHRKYSLLLQLTYLVIILNSLLVLINISINNIELDRVSMYILITVFGMFLYFMLFEFGRSRYLISFWPMIVGLSILPKSKNQKKGLS